LSDAERHFSPSQTEFGNEEKRVGVAGILLEAKTGCLIENVLPHLDALRQKAGFYLSEVLYQFILTLANEIQEDTSSKGTNYGNY
jgi:hypothetical protein